MANQQLEQLSAVDIVDKVLKGANCHNDNFSQVQQLGMVVPHLVTSMFADGGG